MLVVTLLLLAVRLQTHPEVFIEQSQLIVAESERSVQLFRNVDFFRGRGKPL
jgi:hypothetical protein